MTTIKRRLVPRVAAHSASRGWLAAFYGTYALMMAGGLNLVVRGQVAVAFAAPGMMLSGLVGLAFGVRCWRYRGLDDRTRRAWGIISIAFILMLAVPVLFAEFGAVRFPSPGDVVRMMLSLTLVTGLLTFPLRSISPRERRRIGLDLATVVVSGFSMLWYLVVGPGIAMTGASFDRVAAATAYPVTDLVLIFGVATVLLRGTDPSTRRPLSMLAAGGGFFVVGDTYLGYVRANDLPIELINTWPLLCYLTAHFLFATAALHQYERASGRRVRIGPERRVPVSTQLPYVAVGLAYSLMLAAAVAEGQLYPWSGLVAGGIGITGLVVARQVTAQRESHLMAVTDGLTGLANRPRLYDALDQALAQGSRANRTTGVVLADMNGFKHVNDTMGHQAGDQLLVGFGIILRRCVLGSDLVGRLGGDEFVIVLNDIRETANAEAVVRRILAEMQQPIMIDGSAIRLRASFGIAVCAPGEVEADELLHRADLAMYRAKRHGTTGWECYDPTMSAADGATFEDDLRRATQDGQLRIHYQPIVGLPDGQLLAIEALVRWEHPERGLLPPADFIDLAERIGVIEEIGYWVLEHSCQQALQWQRRMGERFMYLSVNVSARQLDNAAFAETVLDLLRRMDFNPRQLVLEVTESASVEQDAAIAQLETLNAAGVRVALDDFGAGSSSLRYLTRMPVDILKLDRSFVAALDGTTKGSAVAEAVIRLGQALQLDIVAEGVEDAAAARELTLLGCHTAQGFHFARPLPADAMDALIDRHAVAPLAQSQDSSHWLTP